jgi:hypothetical protein
MSRPLIPVFMLLALLMAAIVAADPACKPNVGAHAPKAGVVQCDDRGMPGAAALGRPHGTLPTPPALGAPVPAPAPLGDDGPSLLGALARLLGAVLVLAGVMAACILGYRKLVQRAGARAGVLAWATGWVDENAADTLRVTSRRYLGGRESVAVVHAGAERFLVGITPGQVSLLARLEEPAIETLREFTAPPAAPAAPSTPTDSFREAMERSRERLGRLAHLTVVPRDPRG